VAGSEPAFACAHRLVGRDGVLRRWMVWPRRGPRRPSVGLWLGCLPQAGAVAPRLAVIPVAQCWLHRMRALTAAGSTAKGWPASRVRPTQPVKRHRGRVSAGSAGPRAVLRDDAPCVAAVPEHPTRTSAPPRRLTSHARAACSGRPQETGQPSAVWRQADRTHQIAELSRPRLSAVCDGVQPVARAQLASPLASPPAGVNCTHQQVPARYADLSNDR